MKTMRLLMLAGLFTALHAEPNALQWGPEEGNYELPSAVTNCGYKAMRLPTRDELLAACKSGLTKTWDKEGKPYLTSTVASAGRVYTVHSVTCNLTEVDAQYDSVSMRCVRGR